MQLRRNLKNKLTGISQDTRLPKLVSLGIPYILKTILKGKMLEIVNIKSTHHHFSSFSLSTSSSEKMNSKALFYKGEKISRNVKVPYPYKENNELKFNIRDVPFLDGVVDTCRLEKAIMKSPVLLSPIDYEGFNWKDKLYLRMVSSILARRVFEDFDGNIVVNSINKLANRLARWVTGSKIWDFSSVGDLIN